MVVKNIFIGKTKLCCMLVFIVASQFAFAQTTSTQKSTSKIEEKQIKKKGILLGLHAARETMFEVGYFSYEFEDTGKTAHGRGYSISTEHYMNQNYIIAPKVAGFANLWGLNMGIATVWYFDMEKNNSFRVRPEIGIAMKRFKFTYARNIAITNKNMANISKNMFSVSYFINLNSKATW